MVDAAVDPSPSSEHAAPMTASAATTQVIQILPRTAARLGVGRPPPDHSPEAVGGP